MIEKALGKKAKIKYDSIQPGDVLSTYADCSELINLTGFSPCKPLQMGIKNFVDWYLEFYRK
jgi:UDP-glucuronate 4-epimerase